MDDLSRRLEKLTSILDVAKAMTVQRHTDTLLPLIVRAAAQVVDAERCTIFIVDNERQQLWSKVAQGSEQEIRLPLGSGIAGAVATTGQCICLEDAYADPRFNATFDKATGYRTTTMLGVPMRDASGAVTGVIQALNKKRGVFNEEDVELLLALGGQAAGALENALLHEDIHRLFEGFVSASVIAIEARDPSTAGHSSRVAALTLGLARTLHQETSGPYAGRTFSTDELQEIRYASLLHDFGKVGVREHVLVKAEKLYPHELDVLKARFELARKDRQLKSFERRLDAVRLRGEQALDAIEAEESERLAASLRELDETWRFVLQCNQPSVLEQGGFERLSDISRMTFDGVDRRADALLSPAEVELLSIPKGSLSERERREIESHVTHTFRFLSRIPWTRALRGVPEIAYAHHERADGTGYPRAMGAVAIPLQSKMMAISDVYDALTAADRPYKKALPHELALDILRKESERGQLDRDLFRVFVEARVPQRSLMSS